MASLIGYLKGEDLKLEARAQEAEARAYQAEQNVSALTEQFESRMNDMQQQIELKQADQQTILKELTAAQLGISSDDCVKLDNALRCSTVLACGRVIADGAAMVPCKLLKPSKTGGMEEAREHPAYKLLHRRPNDYQTPYEFKEMMLLSAVFQGNGFAIITRDVSGNPIELQPVEPSTVTINHDAGVTSFTVKLKGNKKLLVPSSNMWHLKGPSLDGIKGMDTVKMAADAIGLSLATVRFGKNLFKNGGRPSGVLTAEGKLTVEQKHAIREQWAGLYSGENQLGTAVLGDGLTYTALSVSPDDAQFLQTRKLQIEEICRAFRVLPIMVMHQENATSYASVEQLNLMHFQHTLAPWFVRFEQAAEAALLTDKELDEGYQIKLITRGLMKGSAKERADYYAIMRQNGLMTVNECRDAEDMDRFDDPLADQITPAANLYGPKTTPANNTGDNNSGDTTNE
jgi:HK97 family phage portal protein